MITLLVTSFITFFTNTGNIFRYCILIDTIGSSTYIATTTHKNNETNSKFYRKVTFLMYTEMVNFTPQS